MADITIHAHNEVYVRAFGEEHVMQEIADFFTFYAPDYKWSPRYKAHQWDGKLRLFSKHTFMLYQGLIPYLNKFAAERKYTIEFTAGVGLMNNFSLEEAKDYLHRLDIWSQGKPLAPRDYQIVGVAKAIRYKRMLLLSPTASGKSYMMYAISRYLLDKDCKHGLIVVPTINLVEQLRSDFSDYAHGTWDVMANTHKIYAGQDKNTDKPLTISTWQSIYEQKRRGFFEEFDFVIGDEAHSFKASSLKSIMTKLVNARYRIATTGTLDDWKVHKLTIEGLFGPVSKLTTTKRMIDENQVADLQIKALILKHPVATCAMLQRIKKERYRREIEHIIGDEARNRFLRNLAVSLNGNTLMLFQYVEKHGQLLYDLVKVKTAEGRKVFFIHGGTEVEDREAVQCHRGEGNRRNHNCILWCVFHRYKYT